MAIKLGFPLPGIPQLNSCRITMWNVNGVSRRNLEVTQFLNELYRHYATGRDAPQTNTTSK